MTEILPLASAAAAGLLLGALFFGGLWWTVMLGASSRRPALWFFCSMLLRMGIALAGFYLVGRGNLTRLLVCLVGFVVARLIVQHLTRPPVGARSIPARQTPHAH